MDCEPGVPLHDVMTKVEGEIDDIVLRILWSAAIRDLHLCVKPESHSMLKEIRYEPIFLSKEMMDDNSLITSNVPSDPKKKFSQLAKLHNKLLNDHDNLVNKLPFPVVVLCDSTELTKDIAISLTDKAAQCLQREAKRIDDYLHMMKNVVQRPMAGSAGRINVLARVTARHKDD